jgi:hypothetical protein
MTNNLTALCEADIPYLTEAGITAKRCPIYDGRKADLEFHRNGFELRHIPSEVTDWTDEAEIQRLEYPVLTRLCKEWMGCKQVIFLPSIHRDAAALNQTDSSVNDAPIIAAHADYTEGFPDMIGDERETYAQLLAPTMQQAGVTYADIRAASRIVSVQLWRNFGSPRMDYPLALCDTQTVDRSQFQKGRGEYVIAGRLTSIESWSFASDQQDDSPSRHRWYTFQDMSADDIILFRGYDSDLVQKGEEFLVGHSAIRDPSVPDGMHRHSVEMRAICLF